MKNIHLLPTDKPSRLYFYKGDDKYSPQYGLRSLESLPFNYSIHNQNIYITSDEEIKEGDWVLTDDKRVEKCAPDWRAREWHKKIILTTDQDLIKDGVQAIDDEFLEFIVKNPSCERVEVKKGFADGTAYGYNFLDYKIIIPQEEPKQECIITKIMQMDAKMAYDSLSKQETTLEEVVNNFKKTDVYINEIKQEQEKMYSEEEVKNILINSLHSVELKDNKDYSKIYNGMKEWFEQFKNK